MPTFNGKNAKDHVQDVQSKLMDCEQCLNQAIASVEKQSNKEKIQNTLNSVTNSLEAVNNTLNSYQD